MINFKFEWNAASDSDWHYIERNFIAAYFNAYKDAVLDQLSINDTILQKAEAIWELAYAQACKGNFKPLEQNIYRLLAPMLSHVHPKLTSERDILSVEKKALDAHFRTGRKSDITEKKQYFIRLMALRLYFMEEYEGEKHKIFVRDQSAQQIHYLIARFQDQPVGFVSCELNYKSGRIYMRWVTLSPSFQRRGLGEKLLEEVTKRFPENTGIELYTRVANIPAQRFYKKIGFAETNSFDFSEPTLTDPLRAQPGYFAGFTRKWLSEEQKTTCCAPADESVSRSQDFVGFIKKRMVRM